MFVIFASLSPSADRATVASARVRRQRFPMRVSHRVDVCFRTRNTMVGMYVVYSVRVSVANV